MNDCILCYTIWPEATDRIYKNICQTQLISIIRYLFTICIISLDIVHQWSIFMIFEVFLDVIFPYLVHRWCGRSNGEKSHRLKKHQIKENEVFLSNVFKISNFSLQYNCSRLTVGAQII